MTTTQPELVAPADAFLAAGAPSAAFLHDNLPSSDKEESDRRQVAAAVAIAGTFLAYRAHAAQAIHQEYPSPPVAPETALARMWNYLAPKWLHIAHPVVMAVYHDWAPEMTQDELEAVAADYAASMGQMIHHTSSEAVLAGYREALMRGTSPSLAWVRAVEAYGLDERRLRSWVAQQVSQGPLSDLITPGARRSLERALLLRADLLGQTEAWHARQVAKSIVWMHEAEYLPVGTMKQWLTADDELVCKICGPLHEQKVGLHDQFILPNGQRLWAPGVHPNCRCDLRLVYPTLVFEKAFDATKHPRDDRGRFNFMRAKHKQAHVQTPWGKKVLVDEGMQDLLSGLWNKGLRTTYSCQGGGTGHWDQDGIDKLAYVVITNGSQWTRLAARMSPQLRAKIKKDRHESTDPPGLVVIRMDPGVIAELTQALSSVSKALGDDPYDRDSHGEFARQESRTRKVAKPYAKVAEREVDPAVQALVDAMAKPADPAVDEFVDPFATDDPFDAPADDVFVDPFTGSADPFTPVVDPFTMADPFLVDPFADDPFASDPFTGKTTGRRRVVYVLVNGKLQEVEAEEMEGGQGDNWIYVPADEFYALSDYFDTENEDVYYDEGSTTSAVHEHRLGMEIDFDDWAATSAHHAERRGDPIPSMYLGRVFRGGDNPNKPIEDLEEYYQYADSITPYSTSLIEDRDSMIENLYGELLDSGDERIDYEIDHMARGEIIQLYRNAGLRSFAIEYLNDEDLLRSELRHALFSEPDQLDFTATQALQEAYLERAVDEDEEIQAIDAELDEVSAGFVREPEIFTFKDNAPLGGWTTGGNNVRPLITGKYRVSEIRVHSMSEKFTGMPNPNPRIKRWREVILEPTDNTLSNYDRGGITSRPVPGHNHP